MGRLVEAIGRPLGYRTLARRAIGRFAIGYRRKVRGEGCYRTEATAPFGFIVRVGRHAHYTADLYPWVGRLVEAIGRFAIGRADGAIGRFAMGRPTGYGL